MATLTTNPVSVTAQAGAQAGLPGAVFHRYRHADALAVQFGFDAALLPSMGAFGPFEPECQADLGVMLLHCYTIQGIDPAPAEHNQPWLNSPLLGERFAELSIPVHFRKRGSGRSRTRDPGIGGRLILRQWTTARLQSLIAPRAFGLPVRSASIEVDTVGDWRRVAIRESVASATASAPPSGPGIASGPTIALQFHCDPASASSAGTQPWLLDRSHVFTLHGTTARGFRAECHGANAVETTARFIDGSLLCDLLSGIDSFRLIGAQRFISPYSVTTSLPACLNGPACGLEWNEIKPV